MPRSSEMPPPRMGDLYRDHRSSCMRAALRCGCDQADSEDAVHDVFTRLSPDLLERVPDDGIGAYLARATTNAALDIARRKTRRNERPLTDAITRAIHNRDGDPENAVIAAERRDLARSMVERLSGQCREVMRLKLKGLTNTEIGGRLGIGNKAVERQVTSAYRQMRAMPELRACDAEDGVLDLGRGGGRDAGR